MGRVQPCGKLAREADPDPHANIHLGVGALKRLGTHPGHRQVRERRGAEVQGPPPGPPDQLVSTALRSAGWTVLRIWEHVPPEAALDLIVSALDNIGAESEK